MATTCWCWEKSVLGGRGGALPVHQRGARHGLQVSLCESWYVTWVMLMHDNELLWGIMILLLW